MAIVQNKVSLICPYTKERIKVPVRGRHCIHYACICLETLAITHVTSRGWSCPICSERLNEPRVDMWVMAMLNDNAHGFEVLVKDDGTYVWLGSKLQSNFSLSDSDSETLILGKLQQHTTLMSLP